LLEADSWKNLEIRNVKITPYFERQVQLLGPVFVFFRSDIKFDRIQTDYFQLNAAIRTRYDIAFVRIFIDVDFGFTFRAITTWHQHTSEKFVTR